MKKLSMFNLESLRSLSIRRSFNCASICHEQDNEYNTGECNHNSR